ncbi:MAG TPA: MlaD family protein [Holophagaceae bacterium]|nr:MlaD family protein [Holophagaceae bacterium]
MIVEKNDFRIGLFVVGAVAAFLGLLAFKNAKQVVEKNYPLRVRLENLEGIDVGTPVLLQGYRVGQVERIRLERDGVDYHLEARIAVREDIRLWEGTRALVEAKGLGSPDIALALPEPAMRLHLLQSESVIPGEAGPSLDHVITQADHLMGSLNASIDDLRARFQKQGAGVVLDHPKVAKALADLDAVLIEHKALAKEGRAVVARGGEGMDKVLADLEASLGQVRALLTDHKGDLDQTLTGLAKVTKQMEGLSAALDEAVRTDQPEVKETLQRVQALTTSMQELVTLLKEKPHWVAWGTPSDAAREKARKAVQDEAGKAGVEKPK